MRAPALAVLGTLLLAAAVRLPALGGRSLATAEQATFVESQGFPSEAAIAAGRPLRVAALPSRSGPKPLEAAGLALWSRLAGDSETALRLPAALAGVLTAALVALVAARLAGLRAAAWAGGLAALSPIHALASRQAGPEAPLVLVVALALLLLVRVEESGSRVEAIALGVAVGALGLSAVGGGFALLAVAWLALRSERRAAAAVVGLAAIAVLSAGALAGGARSPLDFGAFPSWVPATSAAGIARCAGASFTRLAGLEYHLVVSRALEVIPLTAALVGLMAFGASRLGRRPRGLLVAGAALPFLLGAGLALVAGRVAPLQAHRMLPAMPFVAVLTALGLASLRGSRGWAAGILVGGTVTAFLALALLRPANESSPTRATASVVAGCRPSVVVVSRPLDLLSLAAWGVPGPFFLRSATTPVPAGAVEVGPSSACAAREARCRALPRCPAD